MADVHHYSKVYGDFAYNGNGNGTGNGNGAMAMAMHGKWQWQRQWQSRNGKQICAQF
jgi:hypothetical protein